MSQAFVREGDHQELSDVSPTLNGLMAFLSRENNGIRVHQKNEFTDKGGRMIHVMSNGLSYCKNHEGKWEVYESD